MIVEDINSIEKIHTLGPAGTNCEKAAKYMRANSNNPRCEIILHDTLEDAVRVMGRTGSDALVACVVYPDLHEIVFKNLSWLKLAETVVIPTHEMVLAKRQGTKEIKSIACHPAPESLVPEAIVDRLIVESNVVAATICMEGKYDGCITTMPAAQKCGLEIVTNFGPIPMGFTLHTVKEVRNATS